MSQARNPRGIDTSAIAALKGKPATPGGSISIVDEPNAASEPQKTVELVVDTAAAVETALRDYETAVATTVSQKIRTLFGNAQALKKREEELSYGDKVENAVVSAINAFAAASGNAFEIEVKSYDRPDFNAHYGLDSDAPAHMTVIALKQAGVNKAKVEDTYAIIAVKKNTYYASLGTLPDKSDIQAVFTGTPNSPNFMTLHDRTVNAVARGSYGSGRADFNRVNGGLADFIDDICAKAMPRILTPAQFNKAMKTFKTMGMMP